VERMSVAVGPKLRCLIKRDGPDNRSRGVAKGSGVVAGPRTMLPSANRKVLPGHGQVTQPSLMVPSSSGPPM